MGGVFQMTRQDISRIELMLKIREKQLSQIDAAKILGLSDRQIRRIYVDFKAYGPKGLLSQRGGREPHNKIPQEAKDTIGDALLHE